MPESTMRLGVFDELGQNADYLWNQCEQGYGRHNGLQLGRWDRSAPHAFVMTWPSPPGGTRRLGGWRRPVYKLLHKRTEPLRMEGSYAWLGHEPATTTVMFYEPPAYLPDEWFAIARRHAARVYAPDPRATHPVVLPSMWFIEADIHHLRAQSPTEKPIALAAISAGVPAGKRLIPGHLARLEFYRKLRRAGVPLELFGRGLPADLGSHGRIGCKGNALRPARFALVIENFAEGDQYVTEKLWDALICWSLPLYFGSRAADKMIPTDSFIRLPDLGDAGVGVVRDALARPEEWDRRLEAMAEARRRAMGELRLVEWLAREAPAWTASVAVTIPRRGQPIRSYE